MMVLVKIHSPPLLLLGLLGSISSPCRILASVAQQVALTQNGLNNCLATENEGFKIV
jgi:hypothetical protein